MAALWRDRNVAAWDAALSACDSAIATSAERRAGLIELDRWYFNDLPSTLSSRPAPFLTKEEHIKLVDWKLARGKSRPGLLSFAKNLDAQALKTASTASFAILAGVTATGGDAALKEALDTMVAPLKGVGPATASAMLCAANANAPFMSDEALRAACAIFRPKYSKEEYHTLSDALREKAASLSSDAGRTWTAADVERALYAATVLPTCTAVHRPALPATVPAAGAAAGPSSVGAAAAAEAPLHAAAASAEGSVARAGVEGRTAAAVSAFLPGSGAGRRTRSSAMPEGALEAPASQRPRR